MEMFKFIFILAYLKYTSANVIHKKLPEVNVTTNMTAHLKYAHMKIICKNRAVCKSNNTAVCAVRRIKDDFEYKNFENSCFLFLSNICDNSEKEFSIVQSGDCAEYLKTRRMYVYSGVGVNSTTETTGQENSTENGQFILRDGKFSTLYPVDTAFDNHICPLRCPDVYSPVCVSANRGMGKYMKFWTFVNHCNGDLYYCKHWEDFVAPDGEDENVKSSPLDWSFCGAHRYMQFARFSEAASAMGHYGWLVGDNRYSHITAPNERIPGYG